MVPISVATSESLPQYSPLAFIFVRVRQSESSPWISTIALLDSGAQGNFISRAFAQRYLFDHLQKNTPLSLQMGDGKPSRGGQISQYTSLQMEVNGHQESLALDITSTPHDIILGAPWLTKNNPSIDWKERTISFAPTSRTEDSFVSHTDLLTDSPAAVPKDTILRHSPDNVDLAQLSTQQTTQSPESQQENLRPPAPVRTPKPKKHPNPKTPERTTPVSKSTIKPPPVSMINGAAMAVLFRQPGVNFGLLSLQDAQQMVEQAEATPTKESDIPEEYHEFTKVFSKEEADKLPPHREYDHRIPVEEGKTPPFGPIYQLSPVELEVLKNYIDDHLRKGFIRHSQSPCAAPVLFAAKPDGGLRLCVDYRGLNKITIKNRYPLPLIGEILERLGNAKFFTKFDVRDGYYRLRMASGEEWKTAFRCRYGLFEYCVMPFGLCNAPGTFQHYVNDTFHEFLDDFLVAYLDDLLIYSKTLKEHKRHVKLVLQRLQDAGLYLKPSKCQFHQTEISFLGYVINQDGIKMDPSKVEAVTQWPTPESVHDIQIFLGFANFYRRFIRGYSRTITAITKLLKKGVKFRWGAAAEKAFQDLKRAFSTAPILRHFDPSKPLILETDASDFAMGAVISQSGDDGKLYPIMFMSRKFIDAELNYEIYDKEMLAIVEAMDKHRHYFEGLGQRTTVYSDHKNLLWFTETKVYNRRQARWAEKLSRFDFVIVFRPGKQGGKPDALSRRPDYTLGEKDRSKTMTFLKPEQIDTTLIDQDTDPEPLQDTDPEPLQEYSLNATVIDTIGVDEELQERIKEALPKDAEVAPYLNQIADPTLPRDEATQLYLKQFSFHENGLLLRNGLVYVPQDNTIKLDILHRHHDAVTAGHQGEAKTLELITRNYTWPRIRQFVNEYVKSCDTCARNKPSHEKRHGQLRPLPIPPSPWSSVSMDYIVELPPSRGCNAIYVVVDRLTKMAHFCPTTTQVTAEETAQLYLRHVFKHHGLPDDIVSDRGSQFLSKFTLRLLQLCDITGNRSTSYHPQSDGQTERVNQVLEQYLRIFCDYQQDDWYQLLPLAEFAYNNASHSSTGTSPFYANFGYHPRATVNATIESSSNPSAEDLISRLKQEHERLKVHLQEAQARYKEGYDVHTKEAPEFNAGDMVWLARKNIVTNRPSAKLDTRRLGPFKILEIVGEAKSAFKLDLPVTMRIHPVFHVSLLSRYRANTIQGRQQPPPPPVEVDGEMEWEVKEVLDSRIHRGKLQYFVDWVGCPVSERTWEPARNLDNAQDAVATYHTNYPNRPCPQDIPRQRYPRWSSDPKRGPPVMNQ